MGYSQIRCKNCDRVLYEVEQAYGRIRKICERCGSVDIYERIVYERFDRDGENVVQNNEVNKRPEAGHSSAS